MKEPKIMRMDWKSLGYEREYKDGKLQWIPAKNSIHASVESKDS